MIQTLNGSDLVTLSPKNKQENEQRIENKLNKQISRVQRILSGLAYNSDAYIH